MATYFAVFVIQGKVVENSCNQLHSTQWLILSFDPIVHISFWIRVVNVSQFHWNLTGVQIRIMKNANRGKIHNQKVFINRRNRATCMKFVLSQKKLVQSDRSSQPLRFVNRPTSMLVIVFRYNYQHVQYILNLKLTLILFACYSCETRLLDYTTKLKLCIFVVQR